MNTQIDDKYSRAQTYLTDHPEQIGACWNYAAGEANNVFDPFSINEEYQVAKCLFKKIHGHTFTGCLTQIRADNYYHYVDDDTAPRRLQDVIQEISVDQRIPTNGDNITVDQLPIFVEWQRKLDVLYPDRHKVK